MRSVPEPEQTDLSLQLAATPQSNRRSVLRAIGVAVGGGTLLAGTAVSAKDQSQSVAHGQLDLLGHHPGERPTLDSGIYTQGSVRDDGQYAVLGGYSGTIGSSLFDLSDPASPELVHRLPSSDAHRQNGVKFLEATDGIYIRTMEEDASSDEPTNGIQIIDYGWGDGTPSDPQIIATHEVPDGVHKLDTHREEPVAYLSDKRGDTPGTIVLDCSDPTDPTAVTTVGPNGYDHALWVDTGREYLYAAYPHGEFTGFAIRDLSDPYDPSVIGTVSYDDHPDYTELGEPGFETCHFVAHDPDRALLVVGDEVGGGVPGGKHIWDIGWDEGTPENPVHLGFTHSPNAELQESDEPFFWTTHMHDIVPKSDTADGRTILVDGGYHEGTWLCDITDPTDPTPAQQHLHFEAAAVDDLEAVPPTSSFLSSIHMPFAWSAEYNNEREFVLTSDSLGGVYTFSISDEAFEFPDPGEAFAQSDDPTSTLTTEDVRTAIHYWQSHDYAPNTGGQPMDTDALSDVITHWAQDN